MCYYVPLEILLSEVMVLLGNWPLYGLKLQVLSVPIVTDIYLSCSFSSSWQHGTHRTPVWFTENYRNWLKVNISHWEYGDPIYGSFLPEICCSLFSSFWIFISCFPASGLKVSSGFVLLLSYSWDLCLGFRIVEKSPGCSLITFEYPSSFGQLFAYFIQNL